MTPFRWEVKNQTGLTWLNWVNDNFEEMKTNPRYQRVNKDIYGGHGGETFAYLVDKSCVIISFDALNNNGIQTDGKVSVTHMPLIMDDSTWLLHRNDTNLSRIYFAAGGKAGNPSVAKEVEVLQRNTPDSWMFWPAIAYPGQTQTPSLGQKDLNFINSQSVSTLESEVNSSGIDPSASLNIWAGFIRINP